MFMYCDNTNLDPYTVSCANVTISYTNCICEQPVDILLLLDSSGSISPANWQTQITFAENITNALTISPTLVNVGIVQFSTNTQVVLGMSSSNTTIFNALEGLRNSQMAQSTATLAGLQQAVSVLNTGIANNPINRSTVPKVIVLLTDGLANIPCSCNSCACTGSGGGYNCNNGLGSCEWNPNYVFCQPCANPIPYAVSVNAKAPPSYPAQWKIVAIGIGQYLLDYNDLGMNMVISMNWNPALTLQYQWSALPAAVQQIVDQSCNV